MHFLKKENNLMTIKALIPVRSGSVRVKNKNIRPFAGTTLLEIKIRQNIGIYKTFENQDDIRKIE